MKKPTLVFATGNPNKLAEVNQLIGHRFEVHGLKDIGCTEDIPETQDTIAGNAWQKARYVKEHYGLDCFAEDTGLEVDALDGAPGVFSARYAGPQKNAEDNMQLLLKNLRGVADRSARFRTVIALILNGAEHTFKGVAAGRIATERHDGDQGFGYDPLFFPEGYDRSFAQMPASAKNEISHRGRAVRQLVRFLNQHL